jgi:hypothetical protein
VGDAAGADFESLVGEEGGVQVGEEVGVGCATFVVAWEDAFEGGYTVTVGLLDTAQVGRVPAVSGIVARLGNSTNMFIRRVPLGRNG